MRSRVRVATETILDKTSRLVKSRFLTAGLGTSLHDAYLHRMVRMLAAGAALALLACNPAGPPSPSRQPAGLSRADAEQLMVRADEARRLAFESAGSATLSAVFGLSALQRLLAQSQNFGNRGMREEERASSRQLVFWDPVALEAVLQVVAERRLVTPDQPNPAWSATVRQWWARLQKVDGTWKVVDEEDLPPDRWRLNQQGSL
jgi:hypothetical protein